MQTISGIHYNFSLPEQAWLLLYLFGASPAVCNSFVAGRDRGLRQLVPGIMYLPWVTSLRMSPLGYQSAAQGSLAVSYNNLDTYAYSLSDALTRFESMAAESLQEQRRIEAADTMPFEVYRQRYLSPDRLRAKRMDETTRRACI
jgi:hypothetical protein